MNTSVLATALLKRRVTMTLANLIKEIISLGLAYNLIGIVHYHHDGEHGGRQTDMMLEN